MTDVYLALALVGVMMPSLIIHEIAHAWTADYFGDPTARRAGRITLNPLKHMDPIGTVVLPVALALVAPFVIGFAKPVPVVPTNLRRPRLHSLLVALAGPGSNFALAAAAMLVFQIVRPEREAILWYVLALTAVVNVVLGLFNMLPIPPLDGSAIIEFAIPMRWRPAWYRVRMFGFFILLGVFLMFRSALDPIFEWAIRLWQVQQ